MALSKLLKSHTIKVLHLRVEFRVFDLSSNLIIDSTVSKYESVEKIIIDSKRLYRKTQRYLEDISPSLLERLELYKLKAPLFESFGIESEIEKLMRPKVWVKI